MPELVDQNDQRRSTRRDVVLAKIRQVGPAVAAAGSIVAGWRNYGGRRLGPFCRLAYREKGVQKSIYIGHDPELVAAAQLLLKELQTDARLRRAIERQRRAVRAGLKEAKAAWAQQLEKYGLHLKGHEVRGWRQASSGS
jgi:hypothetical protein